jgi:hypothetical protein
LWFAKSFSIKWICLLESWLEHLKETETIYNRY